MANTILSRYINDNEELTGWRFEPSDEALVSYFLYNKIIGKELSEFQKMCVIYYDLYGDEEPYDIWNKFEGQENQDLFFITALKNLKKKRNEKGLRYDRKVGGNGGKWHGEDVGKEFEVSVTNCGTRKIEKAIRKRFSYRNPKSDQNGLWIMLEYSLKMDDRYVVCRLRKNVRGANGVRYKKKRGFSAVAAAATDISEYPANKRMRETLMQDDDGLQCVESEFTCENQNQLQSQHESLIEYDPNLEVRECCPSLHSMEVNDRELESAAYCGQQDLVENQNTVEASAEEECAVGDMSSTVEEWNCSNIDDLMIELDYCGSEYCDESNKGFEHHQINNVAVTSAEGESIDEMNGGESESAAHTGQQQEATWVENQNVEEGKCAYSTVGDDWKCCIDELIRDLDYNANEFAGSFDSNNYGFEGEGEGEGDFSSALLKMSSFGQQESDQF